MWFAVAEGNSFDNVLPIIDFPVFLINNETCSDACVIWAMESFQVLTTTNFYANLLFFFFFFSAGRRYHLLEGGRSWSHVARRSAKGTENKTRKLSWDDRPKHHPSRFWGSITVENNRSSLWLSVSAWSHGNCILFLFVFSDFLPGCV